jgi:hypothetical protein
MSACMFFIQFQPVVVTGNDQWMELNEVVGGVPFSQVSVRQVSGSMSGIICKGVDIEKIYKAGTSPNLI